MSLLEVENASYTYNGKKYAVKQVNMKVEKGEYVAIIGHNGSGKSTLAKLFNALLIPTSGKVTVDGFSSDDKNSLFEIRKRVGVVFQNPDNGIIASIVEDDVAFGPENLGVCREEIKERIDFALKAVKMEKFRNSSPERLSGGQKQRIAIAGVLALKPQILVLDESTAMLDPKGRKEILSVVKDLKENQGVTVVAVTHYMDEVLNADKVFVMNEGSIVMQGTPTEIFRRGKELKDLGLELPLASYVAEKLRENGVPVKEGILDEDGLVGAICEL